MRQALTDLATWRRDFLKGDEKGEAQSFIDRLFRALGHVGVQEAGAEFESRIRKDPATGGVSFADLLWKPRVIIEMKKSGTDLRKHYRQAFDYWVRAVPDRPRYVMLCNFDEFWVYDFENQLDEPVDKVQLNDLHQRWEALGFLLPQQIAPAFGNDLVAVTRDAAAKVAKVFRAMTDRGIVRETAQRFVLQCVMAMFSEDIGLLPRHLFTEALDRAKTGAEAYDLIGGLFRDMNTTGVTDGGRNVGTPYFNGGLFTYVWPQELTTAEVELLREAAREDWSTVRPEIFGTIFEQSLDKGERHAQGAHFTSQADIMRIVGPCIVEPWRERIDSAKSQKALKGLLNDLSQYRVLDPACGSGNFLYVAYRELRRIEHEINDRLARLTGRPDQGSLSFVLPENFLGIDVNPFAVEVARITLMLGKKLAADEFGDQGGVLPLDNLESEIVAGDALFMPWPRADVIVGNPPYIGNRKMATDLGADYVARLHDRFGPKGVADFVTYWFPKAHDHLPEGGRAGFVATKSIHQGDGRKASLDYVTANGGVIIDAAKMIPWSGEAQVTVSIVSWQKGGTPPTARVLWLEEATVRQEVANITAGLSAETDLNETRNLRANKESFFQGQTYGMAKVFRVDASTARTLIKAEPTDIEVIHPILGGNELLKSTEVGDWVIDVPAQDSSAAYGRYPKLMRFLEPLAMEPRVNRAQSQAAVNAEISAANAKARVNAHHIRFADQWWTLAWRREDMLTAIGGLDRYIALTRTSSEKRGPVFSFVDSRVRLSDGGVAFPFDDDYSFGVYQSGLHSVWFEAKCTTLETRLTYTSRTVGGHFPWPQDPAPDAVMRVAKAAAAIVDNRAKAFAMGITLAQQYDVLRKPGRSSLRELHHELNDAVMAVYGFAPGSDALAQLLALNHAIADREAAGRAVTGPGPIAGLNTRLSTWAFPEPEL